jgi:hypothetical protein
MTTNELSNLGKDMATTAMATAIAMPAALLKIRYEPHWQIYIGANYERYVAEFNSKGLGYVDIVLIAPVTHADQEERVSNRVNPMKGLASHDDPWFIASTEEALSLFSAVYPPDVTQCAEYTDDAMSPPSAKPQEPAAVQRKLTKLRDSYHSAEGNDPSLWRILRGIDQLCTQAVQLPLDDPATMHALTEAYEVSREFGSPMACIVQDRSEQAIQRTLAT